MQLPLCLLRGHGGSYEILPRDVQSMGDKACVSLSGDKLAALVDMQDCEECPL